MDSPPFVYMPPAGEEEKRNDFRVDDYKEIWGDNSRLMTASSESDCPCSHRNVRARTVICLPVILSVVSCVIVAVVCIIVVLLTHSSLREWEERMEARIEKKIMSIVEERCDFDKTEIRKVMSGEREKSVETTLIRSRREKKPRKGPKAGKEDNNKNKTPAAQNKITNKKSKFVHLNGRNSTSIYSDTGDKRFLWDYHGNDSIQNMKLLPFGNTGAIVAVEIEKAGPYMVYSQVAVNGQGRLNISRLPYDCAHETVLTRNEKDTVLLKSLTTQRFLGEPLPSGHSTDGLKPIDTKLQMGVFYLQAHDTLSVRFWKHCDHFNYVMQPDHSYFGVIQMKL